MSQREELKIFAGNSNLPLAREVCEYLHVSLGRATVETFSDGESKVEIKENVRGGDVFVLQSTCAPGNDNLMELLVMLDAFKRASAKRMTAVILFAEARLKASNMTSNSMITSWNCSSC